MYFEKQTFLLHFEEVQLITFYPFMGHAFVVVSNLCTT